MVKQKDMASFLRRLARGEICPLRQMGRPNSTAQDSETSAGNADSESESSDCGPAKCTHCGLIVGCHTELLTSCGCNTVRLCPLCYGPIRMHGESCYCDKNILCTECHTLSDAIGAHNTCGLCGACICAECEVILHSGKIAKVCQECALTIAYRGLL